jgi:hypothetical protein
MILVDLTACPECGRLAEVEWRDVLESTDGPVEHARVSCVGRHRFFLPAAMLGVQESCAGRAQEVCDPPGYS